MPDFWEHPKEAQAQMKKIKDLQAWVNGYHEVETAVDELSNGWDFYKEELLEEAELDTLYADAVKKIEALELRNMLRREEDHWEWCSRSIPEQEVQRARTGPRCSCACICVIVRAWL